MDLPKNIETENKLPKKVESEEKLYGSTEQFMEQESPIKDQIIANMFEKDDSKTLEKTQTNEGSDSLDWRNAPGRGAKKFTQFQNPIKSPENEKFGRKQRPTRKTMKSDRSDWRADASTPVFTPKNVSMKSSDGSSTRSDGSSAKKRAPPGLKKQKDRIPIKSVEIVKKSSPESEKLSYAQALKPATIPDYKKMLIVQPTERLPSGQNVEEEKIEEEKVEEKKVEEEKQTAKITNQKTESPAWKEITSDLKVEKEIPFVPKEKPVPQVCQIQDKDLLNIFRPNLKQQLEIRKRIVSLMNENKMLRDANRRLVEQFGDDKSISEIDILSNLEATHLPMEGNRFKQPIFVPGDIRANDAKELKKVLSGQKKHQHHQMSPPPRRPIVFELEDERRLLHQHQHQHQHQRQHQHQHQHQAHQHHHQHQHRDRRHERQLHERQMHERNAIPELPPRMADLDESEFMQIMEMEMKKRMHREMERERHMEEMMRRGVKPEYPDHHNTHAGYAEDCYYGYNDLPRRPDERKFPVPLGRTLDYYRQMKM